MKNAITLKRILCLLLICSTVFLLCACNSDGNKETDPKDTEENGDSTSDSSADATEATDKPLLATDVLISGDKPYRIIYSDGYRSEAIEIQDKLISLDKNYTVGKYSVAQDTTKEADGTPEILIGDTNRPASAEAKAKIAEGSSSYSIYVADGVIALCAPDADGVKAGLADLKIKFSKKNDSVIYNNVKGSYTKEYESFNNITLLEALAKTAKENSLPVYSISVSTADGISTQSITPGNPCQNCYSVAKVYCVTAIGMLYDEGKIKTTDTIGDIFAEEIEAYGIDVSKWANVTIHDVLRHRAGFKQGGLLDIDASDSTKWGTDFLKYVLEAELAYEPGEKSVYTDAAFYLISRVVTKISGQKLDVFLAERLFNKTECREYAFSRCPQGYPIGATGIYIRSADVAKLGRIYLNYGEYNGERIISKEWIETVLENDYELHKTNTGYAKGGMRGQYLYIDYTKDVAAAWHSYDPNGVTGPVGDTLKEYLSKK